MVQLAQRSIYVDLEPLAGLWDHYPGTNLSVRIRAAVLFSLKKLDAEGPIMRDGHILSDGELFKECLKEVM